MAKGINQIFTISNLVKSWHSHLEPLTRCNRSRFYNKTPIPIPIPTAAAAHAPAVAIGAASPLFWACPTPVWLAAPGAPGLRLLETAPDVSGVGVPFPVLITWVAAPGAAGLILEAALELELEAAAEVLDATLDEEEGEPSMVVEVKMSVREFRGLVDACR